MGCPARKEIQLENGTTAMVASNSFPINTEKFKQICKDRSILYADIARKIGYASNSISSAIDAKYMTGVMIKGLENVYGIKYEDYAYIPEKPVEKSAEQPEEKAGTATVLPESALYDTVKAAVTDAINEALAGNMKNLRGMVYTAIVTAMNAKKEA